MRWALAVFALCIGAAQAQAQMADDVLAQAVLPPGPRDADTTPEVSDRRYEEVEGENQTVVVGHRPVSPDRTQDVITIPGERLRESPKPNLFEALAQESAGIHVTRRGVGPAGVSSGASGSLTIRGLGGSPNDQVVVVEDGVPDVQGIFGHPLPDAYVPDLLDEVVVVEGGDSVLYGTNAMGAAILLRSRWRDTDGWEVGSDTSYGSYTTLGETATALLREGAWDGVFALHAMRTDGHRDGAGGSDLVVQGAGRYRFDSGWSVTLRDKAVHVVGGDPGTIEHPYTDHTFDVWRDNLSARVEYVRPDLRVTLLPYANVGRHDLYDGFRSLDWTVGGNAEVSWRPHPDWTLLLGLNAQDVDGSIANRIAGTSPAVDAMFDLAHYNQITWRPTEGLALVAGTREMYSFKYGFVFLAKAGIRWDFWDGMYARTRLTRNFRQPTIRELYLPYPVANPDLQPETSLNWDVTLGYNDFKHIDVSVTGFRTQANDLIKYFGAYPAAEVVNIDFIVVWGVEGRIAVRDLGPFGATVSGMWQDVGRYTRQNPAAKLDFQLDLGQDFGPHRVAGSVSGEWDHGLFMNNYGRDPIPDVFFMDLAFRYRYTAPGKTWFVEPYLYMRNFLDRRYEYIQGYQMPGFNALVGLKVGV